MRTEQLKQAVVKSKEGEIMNLKVERTAENTVLSVSVAQEIEGLFRNPEFAESEHYQQNGQKLRYYKFKEGQEEELNSFFDGSGKINKYGSTLLFNGYNNFSLLRTVGITQGIKLETTGLISEEKLTEWCSSLKTAVVKLYKNYVRPIEITVILEKREVV